MEYSFIEYISVNKKIINEKLPKPGNFTTSILQDIRSSVDKMSVIAK